MIEKITFIGSKHLGIRSLQTIYGLAPDKLWSIVTLNDHKDTRCKLDEFKEFAKHSEKKLHILNKPSEFEAIIKEDSPDMCIVVGWYWLIKKNILENVPNGFLGIHPSLLPKYRGGAPLIWPIINGDKESGVSLFYLDNDMDAGDVVDQKRFDIADEDTVADILVKTESLATKLFKNNLPLIFKNKESKVPQDHNAATYYSMRKPEDGRINWHSSSVEIYNFIRAQTHPYPGAFCYVGNKKMYLWKSRVAPQEYHGIPGLVVKVSDTYVVVVCGKGAICLYKVQIENSKEETAGNVLKYGEYVK